MESSNLKITDLPRELLVQIFSHLPKPPTLEQAWVCRVFADIAQDEFLWRNWADHYSKLYGIKYLHVEGATWKTHQRFIKFQKSLVSRYSLRISPPPEHPKRLKFLTILLNRLKKEEERNSRMETLLRNTTFELPPLNISYVFERIDSETLSAATLDFEPLENILDVQPLESESSGWCNLY
ncbi:MAG: hypothetical protein K940chlam3_00362 [Chlamydiae bacterium]|nr:hypothetical protein [Chlamydiota bacterium]